MLFGFFVGCAAGSLLTAVALLLAIGVTSQRDDVYVRPVNVAPRAPTEIPQAALYPRPDCPECGVEMDGTVNRWDRQYPVAFYCTNDGTRVNV